MDSYLRNVSVVLRRISTIVTCLPLPFISYTLDEIFVEIADIQVPDLMGSKLKSELSFPRTQLQVSVKLMGPCLLQGIGETEGRTECGLLFPDVCY